MNRPLPPDNYTPFGSLPVRYVTCGNAERRLAIHVSGRFTVDQPPIVCVSGFVRNMTDFDNFMRQYRLVASIDWPFVLVDLAGRGRSSDHEPGNSYSAISDAHDLSSIARALGISRATFVGQGHGGQVIMALAAQHPTLLAAAVLINSGPTTNPRGLVRLRSNLRYLESVRGTDQVQLAMRKILSADYPGLSDVELDSLAARTHFVDSKGRSHGLFDPELIQFLDAFDHDDIFEPQWNLFDALAHIPLMLARTQMTDRLDNDTFKQMIERHPGVATTRLAGEGSPALLNNEDEVEIIADFISRAGNPPRRWAHY